MRMGVGRGSKAVTAWRGSAQTEDRNQSGVLRDKSWWVRGWWGRQEMRLGMFWGSRY